MAAKTIRKTIIAMAMLACGALAWAEPKVLDELKMDIDKDGKMDTVKLLYENDPNKIFTTGEDEKIDPDNSVDGNGYSVAFYLTEEDGKEGRLVGAATFPYDWSDDIQKDLEEDAVMDHMEKPIIEAKKNVLWVTQNHSLQGRQGSTEKYLYRWDANKKKIRLIGRSTERIDTTSSDLTSHNLLTGQCTETYTIFEQGKTVKKCDKKVPATYLGNKIEFTEKKKK